MRAYPTLKSGGLLVGKWFVQFHKVGPLLLIALFLICIGMGIHRKSLATQTPPFYDSLSYYEKGKGVWNELKRGRILDTFIVEPVSRPPGTVLLSFPLGFSDNLAGFFFRSSYVPIFLWLAAFWLRVSNLIPCGRDRWLAASFTIGLGSLSMFYHFDFNPDLDQKWEFCHTWGMQDAFLASLAALSTAIILIGARKQSINLTICGGLVAAWTLLVKPAGVIVMSLVFFAWLIETCLQNWPMWGTLQTKPQVRRYFFVSAGVILLLFGGVIAFCMQSRYLSMEFVRYMNHAISLLYKNYANRPVLPLLYAWITPTFGWIWFPVLTSLVLAMAFAAARRVIRRRPCSDDMRFVAALVGFMAALYWWIFMSGLQVRYFFPFLLLFLVIVLPEMLRAISRLRGIVQIVLASLFLFPSIFLLTLIFSKRPSISGQRLLGVSLGSNVYRNEAQIGKILVHAAHEANRQINAYCVPSGVPGGIAIATTRLAQVSEPDRPAVWWYTASDWVRGYVVRRAPLSDSDFIYFNLTDDPARYLRLGGVQDSDEEALFSAWFEQLTPEDGVLRETHGSCGLLKVIDHAKLDESFLAFVSKRRWPASFEMENREMSRSDLKKSFDSSSQTLLNIMPADAFSYRMHSAVFIEGKANGAFLPSVHMSFTAEPNHICLQPTGSRPSFQLPEIELPKGKRALIHIQISRTGRMNDSPRLRLLYTQKDAAGREVPLPPGPREPNGPAPFPVRGLASGANDIYCEFPSDQARLQITLAFPPVKEDFLLQSIEIKAVLAIPQ